MNKQIHARFFENSQEMLCLVQRDGTLLYPNAAWRQILGDVDSDGDAPSLFDRIHPDERHDLQARWMRMVEARERIEFEARYWCDDGHFRWLALRGSLDHADDLIYTLAEDITGRKQTEQALRRSVSVLKAEQETTLDGILVINENRRIVSHNERFREIWKLPLDLCQIGDDDLLVNQILSLIMDADEFLRTVEYLYDHPLQTHHSEIKLTDGRILERYSSPIRSTAGEYFGRVWYFRDDTERRKAEEALRASESRFQQYSRQLENRKQEVEEANRQLEEANRQLEEANLHLIERATTDGLTGLKNHRAFQERLMEEFRRSKRYSIPLSLILLDVDHFKQYNDTFGHPAGDVVLRQIADILQREARVTDIAARYGGEEFVLILTETKTEEAIEVADRLRQAIESATWPERAITASLGVATLTSSTTEAADLVALADGALYQSKRFGRNRVTHSNLMDTAKRNVDAGILQAYHDMVHYLIAQKTEELLHSPKEPDEAFHVFDETVLSWLKVLDNRDHGIEGHSVRVAEMTLKLGHTVGMTPLELRDLNWGALLHDIGKIGIPDAILNKPGELTEEEWRIIRCHPATAWEMLSNIRFLQSAVDIPYCHHEKWNGTGYPRGLKGEQIPIAARLFAVIDTWDALRSDRPYRKRWPKQKAIRYLRSQSGEHFDPRAVKTFLQLLAEGEMEINLT